MLFDGVGETAIFTIFLLESVIGVSTFDFIVEDDVDVDECFEILGAVDVVLLDCVDRRDDTEDGLFLLLRLLLGRPLLPRALDKLLSSPLRRVFDLRVVAEEEVVLGVEGDI